VLYVCGLLASSFGGYLAESQRSRSAQFKRAQWGRTERGTYGVRKPCRFTERDVRRAIRAVKKEGVSATIDVMPDGRISIIPTTKPDITAAASDENEWDEAAHQ
jgi:hypothetical protein